MKHKGKIAAVAAGVLCTGILLGAAQGTQTDPLVTLSYLNSITTPKILKDVDVKLDTREKDMTARLDAAISLYAADMERLLAEAGIQGGSVSVGTTGTGMTSVFSVVTVEAGKKLVGGVGTELLLRSGTAVCVAASEPGLIDATDGTTLASGGALVQNHLYLSAAEGRGFTASAPCTVLVRGSYSVQ